MSKSKSISYKQALTVIFFVFVMNALSQAQCLSGDCENGKGKARHYNGVYEGEFKDGLPNGNGQWLGKVRIYNGNTDSVRDIGLFQEGVFVKGKRLVIVAWEGFPNNEHQQRFAGKFPIVNGYFMVPDLKPPKESDYPRETSYTSNSGKKQQEIKGYYYDKTYQGISFSWYGKLNKGLMDGEGDFRVYSNGFFLKFEKGKPVGEATKVNGNWAGNQQLELTNIIFRDGKVSTLKFINKEGDVFTSDVKLGFFELRDLIPCDGDYTIQYKNGMYYNGEILNGLPHGYGSLTQTNGTSYQGYFYKGYSHGLGKLMVGETLKDTGVYIFSKLMKGTFLQDGKRVKYPVCISGDCENGYGKANYSVGANTAIINVYEGNFINGLPFGFGEITYQNAENKYTKRGSFSAGQLMGEGTINANYGNLRKIAGKFNNDTLVNGVIDYSDGTRFKAEKTNPLVFGIHTTKNVRGFGTYYTKSGSVVKGEFFEGFSNLLFKGNYRRADGVVFEFEYNGNDLAKQYRIAYDYNIDQLDNMAGAIIAKIQQVESDLARERAIYIADKERSRKQAVETDKSANWREDTRSEICGSCSGYGEFTYTNTFGARTTLTFVDQRGAYVSGGDKIAGRTYTRKVSCSACNGKGKVEIKSRKYIGPVF